MIAKGLLRLHWVGFLFLVPFLILLGIHRVFGLSDALLGAPEPGEREVPVYNIALIVVFYAGVLSFIGHTFAVAEKSRTWRVAKIIVLVIYWVGVVAFM